VQRDRVLARERAGAIHLEQLQHVGEDRANAVDPREVGPADQPLEDRLVDARQRREASAAGPVTRRFDQLMGVGDALAFEPVPDPIGDPPQLADVQ
jgi:hypothetical protein